MPDTRIRAFIAFSAAMTISGAEFKWVESVLHPVVEKRMHPSMESNTARRSIGNAFQIALSKLLKFCDSSPDPAYPITTVIYSNQQFIKWYFFHANSEVFLPVFPGCLMLKNTRLWKKLPYTFVSCA
jgi:hypothetical protein